MHLAAEVGWAIQGGLTCRHPPGYQRLNYFAYSTYFKTYEFEDVSIIIIIQVK